MGFSVPAIAHAGRGEGSVDEYGPYVLAERDVWADLATQLPVALTEETLARVRSRLDTIDLKQVREVYLPLTELIRLYVEHTGQLYSSTHDFLGLSERRTPFVIGVAGSVAVGKSTTSRLLVELLSQLPGHPRVDLVTTDGFLHPNAELERRGIMDRKGFPESYDRPALLKFVMDVKSGAPVVAAPVYSHLVYDVIPGRQTVVRHPDILIIEGLNVLQPARVRSDSSTSPAVSDFFDFSVYVDACEADLRAWYLERFARLRETAFQDPRSYFAKLAALSDSQALAYGTRMWDTINAPNLRENILPTRGRATVILRKNSRHDIEWIRIRKI